VKLILVFETRDNGGRRIVASSECTCHKELNFHSSPLKPNVKAIMNHKKASKKKKERKKKYTKKITTTKSKGFNFESPRNK
jgi:hypothetical protein